MSKKNVPSTETNLFEFETIVPDASSISFEDNSYPVKDGIVSLTAAQAAPLLAVGAIRPASKPAQPKSSQPALDLPAE
jgi:hypothetical protein